VTNPGDLQLHIENADRIAKRIENLTDAHSVQSDGIIRDLARQIRSELHHALAIIRKGR